MKGKIAAGALENGAAVFLIFLLCLFIVGGTAAAFLLIRAPLFRTEEGEEIPAAMTYVIGEKTYKNVQTESYFVGTEVYINFSDIVSLCELAVTGEKGDLTFLTPGGETLNLVTGNTTALVNGNPVSLGGRVLERDGNLWVPMRFLQNNLLGVEMEIGKNKDRKTVLRVTRNGEEPAFRLKANTVLERLDISSVPPEQRRISGDTPVYKFTHDLSSFYPYMDPAEREEYLILANPAHPTGAGESPADLVAVLNAKKGTSLQLRLCAEKSLEALFIEMYAAGYSDVTARTGFRTFETQKKYYDNYLYNEKYYYRTNFSATGQWFSDTAFRVLGETYLQTTYIDRGIKVLSDSDAATVTRTYSAAPGTSDHQTGLGCDMHNLTSGSTAFAETDAYLWLRDNAYKFGFIERYPEDKTSVTGFSWEPYHWRFVGQYHAAKMHESGLCLEEYVASLSAPR